ncbi:hypothetical protein Ddye_012010 [Dipteronia dyeriana]|uniref:Reverse transcriptase domain-containing protein n=1 Tax=Dipteronia dyeriana TaxID=168575 RepID=A0AAD9X3M8_9ROSI|nr:hypothetical protein Ddye_012010 [Dipteronia dyeriana]
MEVPGKGYSEDGFSVGMSLSGFILYITVVTVFPPKWKTNLFYLPYLRAKIRCSFSPHIFILCAEAFACLITKFEKLRYGLGLRCSRGSPLISHMFFTDDSILFYKASPANCDRIKEILKVYEKGSDQQINLNKSKITFSPKVSLVFKLEFQSALEIQDCNSQEKYLGLPFMVGRSKIRTFIEIKDRVWKKFQSWKDNHFSFEGKEILIKMVAQENRNTVRAGGNARLLELVFSKAINFLSEFQSSKQALSPVAISFLGSLAEWIAPPLGQLKLNFAIIT